MTDKGIGMTEDVRRRCTEAHFSTKRDNVLFAGLSAGMGLGLSFVVVILDHHDANRRLVNIRRDRTSRKRERRKRPSLTFPPINTRRF